MKHDRLNPIKYEDLKADSIQHWAEELEKCKLVQITDEQAELFLKCTLAEVQGKQDDDEWFEKSFLGSFNGVALLWNRVNKVHTYKITHAVAIWLGAILKNPGNVTIMANYLQYKAWKHHLPVINMEMLGAYVHPEGLFSPEDLEQAWDAQKVEYDGLKNMLDMYFPMKSIRDIPERTEADKLELDRMKRDAWIRMLQR